MQTYRIPLIKPYMSQRVKTMVDEVLDSGYLTEGPVTRRFESAIAAYTRSVHAVAFTSCTTGLETALRVAGMGPGDEVIVPDFTYSATAHAVQIVGAVPVIVDIDPDTMLMDAAKVRDAISPATRAIIPVSLFGNPLPHPFFQRIKEEYELVIIEDAACALGSKYDGQPTGSISDMSVFSFHPRKFITTGEGGMVTTNNPRWAEALEGYKHFGMRRVADSGKLAFLTPGTNYKMSDILAAVGLAQMEMIDELLAERQHLAARYKELLGDAQNIRFPEVTAYGEHAYQSFVVFVSRRDEVMKEMREQGIEVQIGTFALHQHPAFQDRNTKLRGQYPGSLKCFEEALVLPLFHGMTRDEQTEVADKLMICVE